MQIVIEIDDDTYKQAKDIVNIFGEVSGYKAINAIANGTPLPPHGRLIDVDELSRYYQVNIDNNGISKFIDYDNLENAPTILEADKAESEERNEVN